MDNLKITLFLLIILLSACGQVQESDLKDIETYEPEASSGEGEIYHQNSENEIYRHNRENENQSAK